MKIKLFYVSVFLAAFIFSYFLTFEPASYKPHISIKGEADHTHEIPAKPVFAEDIEIINTNEEEDWLYKEEYQYKIRLLETGKGFHGDEVPARDGEHWLGFFKENGNMSLKKTRVTITRVHDILDDEKVKAKTGKDVSVTGKMTDPLFLLKNAVKLKEGSVKTFFTGPTYSQFLKDESTELSPDDYLTILKPGFRQTYDIGGEKYVLKAIEARNQRHEKILALIMEGAGKRQVIHTIYADASQYVGILYWAGDLDRDQKPDLYLELYEHDNVDNKVLLLSSEADTGQLVKISAYFWTTGC